MTIDEIIIEQIKERKDSLKLILASKSSKKIIIAGAGTGKTFTFKEVLKASPTGYNIAMTFIRTLSYEMHLTLGDLAEVKTFHAYCKKILHEQNGKVELFPFLTDIIEEDSQILRLNLSEFDEKFQLLDEKSQEVKFYLSRGDYYDAVSFNDSVYRLYKMLQSNPNVIPNFNNILIDEYQDFNPLEVAFIDELEKKGNILIVGDDDQSVYDGRNASSSHLRDKFNSGNYETFELPFCSRCTEVIVKVTNSILAGAQKRGFLKGRVLKKYECFLESKMKDNTRFPKIISVQFKVGSTVPKYIDYVIQNIDQLDIDESWNKGSEYPTVLIVGPKQYLTIIENALIKKYPQLKYKSNEELSINVTNGYDILLKDPQSNLGWRIIINFYLNSDEVKSIIGQSKNGKPMVEIIDKKFLNLHLRVIEILSKIKNDEEITKLEDELKNIVLEYFDDIIDYYAPKEKEKKEKPDKTKPSILLSSFVGCKGLSAGYVIIVGANNGSIPKDIKNIKDVEISQFIVALTRTRKQCHIVSNQWLLLPKIKGIWQEKFNKTIFLKLIPEKYIDDKGLLSTNDIK